MRYILILFYSFLLTTFAFSADNLLMFKNSEGNTYQLLKIDQSSGSETVVTSITLDTGISTDNSYFDAYENKFYLHQGAGLTSEIKVYDFNTDSWSDAKRSSGGSVFSLAPYQNIPINKMIRVDSNGALHIGENSLVTQEIGGRQQLYATNSSGNRIDINIPSGTNLLIDGEDVMGSIDSSIALGAAFSSLPTGAEGAGYTCGLGTGFHDSASAISGGCGFDFANYSFVDSMPEIFQKASFNIGAASVVYGEGDDATLKAGIRFKFGAPKPVREARDNDLLLENKIDAVMAKNETIQAENDLLKAQIAEINIKLKALNMLAMN